MSNSQSAEIDVVELSITCFAAVLIVTAVSILIYFFCTTAAQRERHCRGCKEHRCSMEQNQTSPCPPDNDSIRIKNQK